MELSLYQTGWVTLSGSPFAGSYPTIEHRQEVIDNLIEELWPDLAAGKAALVQERASASEYSDDFGESFVLDWGRSASDSLIQQFIQGWNRTPKQLQDIIVTWELKRGWDHGSTPDSSFYCKRILEEGIWLRRKFGWSLPDVVDIAITFCKKNHLRWSFGRAKKQIADGLRYISIQTREREGGCVGDSALLIAPTTTIPLTCKSAQIIEAQNQSAESAPSPLLVKSLALEKASTNRDTFDSTSTIQPAEKVSRFQHKSVARDRVFDALKQYRGWVKSSTVATKAGIGIAAAKKQLQRLTRAGFVDGDGKGRYRKHRERQPRKVKPCRSKPIQRCRRTDRERKSLTRGELKKRGWPVDLIDRKFPTERKDYEEKEITLSEWSGGRVVKTRIYQVLRIKAFEMEPEFENERESMRSRGPVETQA